MNISLIRKYQIIPVKLLLILLVFTLSVNAQTPDPDPERFGDPIQFFMRYDSKNSYKENAILFVGSSSIRMWPTAESFPEKYVINRGFGGSHISDVNYFYEKIVKKYRPARIFFYAGDNDIAAGKSPDQVLEDYQNFVEKVEQDLPKTKIYYLPIKPSINRWKMWTPMEIANSMIRDFIDKRKNLFYIDTASPMLNDAGKPNYELFLKDGLHLNEKGYELWNQILRSETDVF